MDSSSLFQNDAKSAPTKSFPWTNAAQSSYEARIFEELLDAEVSVNPTKLREASRFGIPALYRGTVYRYLLGIAFMDKSSEMTLERTQEKDFHALLSSYDQTIGAGIMNTGSGGNGVVSDTPLDVRGKPKYHSLKPSDNCNIKLITRNESKHANGIRCSERNTANSHAVWGKVTSNLNHSAVFMKHPAKLKQIELALRALQVAHSEASPDDVETLLFLAMPFNKVSSQARDVFYCTETVFHLLTHYGNILQDDESFQHHCGTFLMLFRATNAALYQHFFVEGVTVLEWVPGMLCTLLSSKLHDDDLLRLWDAYLADAWLHLGFPLHPYVCLALLSEMTEELIECEKQEIIERLSHLPRIDASRILQKAISFRESTVSKGLV